MTYSLSQEELAEIRDLIYLLNLRIDSGGDGEEPTLQLDADDQARAAELV